MTLPKVLQPSSYIGLGACKKFSGNTTANRQQLRYSLSIVTAYSVMPLLVCRGLQSGTVWVNTWNQFDAAVPFGGYKLSGIGREHGEEVLSHYTQVSS